MEGFLGNRLLYTWIIKFEMEQYEPHAQDYCIVRMMRKVHEQLQTSNANSIECLLLEEKIIYSAILHFERQ